jgi:ABC-type bacteriocin/lantibiotic exporter with double-glycine peptidase domain
MCLVQLAPIIKTQMRPIFGVRLFFYLDTFSVEFILLLVPSNRVINFFTVSILFLYLDPLFCLIYAACMLVYRELIESICWKCT